MKTLTLTAVLALLIATPVMAQSHASDEPEGVIEWQNLVAKANADRLARAGIHAEGNVAAIKGTTATDAAQVAVPAASTAQPTTGRYQRMEDYWQDRS